MTVDPPIPDGQVAAKYADYSDDVLETLMALRTLVFDVAQRTAGVGSIIEALKWGQPSFLTEEPRSGTTVRIDQVRGEPGVVALMVNCQTTLIQDFRHEHGDRFVIDGTRGIRLAVGAPIPERELGDFIEAALTYRLRQR